MRQDLFEWFSTVRYSLDCKIMVRFPPKLVEMKAMQLCNDYVELCILVGVQPDPPPHYFAVAIELSGGVSGQFQAPKSEVQGAKVAFGKQADSV